MRFARNWLSALAVVAGGLAVLPQAGLGATAPAPSLKFLVQPSKTVVNQVITGADINPSGPPLQVEILNGDGNVITTSSAPVTIALGANPGGGTLSGTTTVNAVNGVATFSDLSINQPGSGYVLAATSPGANPTSSRPFDEVSSGTTCTGSSTCTTTATTPVSALNVTAPAGTTGTLSITVDAGVALVCPGYTAQDTNWYSFLSTSNATGKTLTYTVRPASAGSEIVGATQFCLGAPYDFESRAGAPAPAGTLPDGSSGFIGLLPNCGKGSAGPCVAKRATTPDSSSPTGFDVVLTLTFPAGLPGDPWGRA